MVAAKGWFKVGDRDGDRTLQEQLTGLDPLWPSVPGSSVLDVGCAEGLIALECLHRGASKVVGIDILVRHVSYARRASKRLHAVFDVADAGVYEPSEWFDVVLLLAVLHKLRDPSGAARKFASVAKALCVVRYPGSSDGRVIVDARSGDVPHDIDAAIIGCGFERELKTAGPFDEPTVFYRRV